MSANNRDSEIDRMKIRKHLFIFITSETFFTLLTLSPRVSRNFSGRICGKAMKAILDKGCRLIYADAGPPGQRLVSCADWAADLIPAQFITAFRTGVTSPLLSQPAFFSQCLDPVKVGYYPSHVGKPVFDVSHQSFHLSDDRAGIFFAVKAEIDGPATGALPDLAAAAAGENQI
jgi:hypothetical protein